MQLKKFLGYLCGVGYPTKISMEGSGKFLYFAYGSNLSTERIHLNNPSAIAKGPALLDGYKLDFNYGSNVSNNWDFLFIGVRNSFLISLINCNPKDMNCYSLIIIEMARVCCND